MEEERTENLPFEERKNVVLESIRNKEYEIEIEEPNNIITRTHPDGSEFYYIRDDDAKFGAFAGICRVGIAGISFKCELEWGEWSGDDDELIADKEVMDAIKGIDGVIYGEHHTSDEYIAIFEVANNCKVDEYYGHWEENIPLDADDIVSLDRMQNVTEAEFKGRKYYVINDEKHEADEEHNGKRWAYAAFGEPDNWGRYNCSVVLLEAVQEKADIAGEVITEVMECDMMMDQQGYIEQYD